MAEAKEEEAAPLPEESKPSAEERAAVEELAAAHKWVLGDVFTKQELAQHGVRTDAAVCAVLQRSPFFEFFALPPPEETKEDPNEEQFDPDQVEPLNAFNFTSGDLKLMLDERGVAPKGFFNDDARTLQKLLDDEHATRIAELRAEFDARVAKKRQTEFRHKHRLQVVKGIREEADTIVASGEDGDLTQRLMELHEQAPQVLSIADVLRASPNPSAAGRCLAKVLYSRVSTIISLDLSRAGLDDTACAYIARACRAPGSVLASLDLEGNDAGPKACAQLAETIAQTSLKALSLEGNNLTQGGEDGFKELCRGLRSSSLTRLSLWRCNLPQSCGPCLADGVGPSLFLLETGGNLFLERDLDDIEDRLRANRDARDRDAEEARLLRRRTRKEAKAKAAADALAAKQRDVEEFLARRKQERAEKREQEAKEKAEAEAQALLEREAREKQRLKEAASGKKKGKKGKKGKGKKKK